MQLRTTEERESIVDAIKKDLSEALLKYEDKDLSREIIFALADYSGKVKPCPDVTNWDRFLVGAFR